MFFYWKLFFLEDISLFCNSSMEVVISPGNMYQVLFMETLEIVNDVFSGSYFVEVNFFWNYSCPNVEETLITLAI